MSVQELAGESWREYVGEMSEDVRQTVAFHSDVYIEGFEKGYTRGQADALLIAEYGRRLRAGEFSK